MYYDDAGLDYYCVICKMSVNETSKHCKTCNKCIEDFDHHCMWLNNCIGGKNYKEFIKFIVFANISVFFKICIEIVAIIKTN